LTVFRLYLPGLFATSSGCIGLYLYPLSEELARIQIPILGVQSEYIK